MLTATDLNKRADSLLTSLPEQALTLARQALQQARDTADRAAEARALLLAGQAAYRLANLPEAQEALQQATALFTELGDRAAATDGLITLSRTYRDQGKYRRGLSALDQAQALNDSRLDPGPDSGLNAMILNLRASIAQMTGDSEAAALHLQAALALQRQLGDTLGEAQCLNNLGQIHLMMGRHPEALEVLFQAHALLKATGDVPTTAHCFMNLASVYNELGEAQQAYEYDLQALQLGQAIGDRHIELHCLVNLGDETLHLNRFEEAERLFLQALSLADTTGSPYLKLCAHHGLGQARAALGRVAEAREHFGASLTLALDLGEHEGQLRALLGLSSALLTLNRTDDAEERARQALVLAQQESHARFEAQAHALLADCGERHGRFADAVRHLRQQHALERQLTQEENERKTRQFTVQFAAEIARHDAEMYRLQTETAQRARQEAEARVHQRTLALAQAQLEVVTRLANAAEFRDQITADHTLRVGYVAELLALELGVSEQDATLLRVAARLHDVGKIGVPDTILLKPGLLDAAEYEQMKAHTVMGSQILAGGASRLLQLAEQIALYHHERWNGSGYPYGLSGPSIPTCARIVAAADVYDALTHNRQYKQAWPISEVMAEFQRQRGRHFEPAVVDALVRLHARGVLPVDVPPKDDQKILDILSVVYYPPEDDSPSG
ncbi:tetratricopeptide repeat protein [Deinococcus depolymerans]|uniref:Tetratricopeptide repeat protein n=1 Tax=Deinococcus depolymerans TaxID=392408 RepID=A0ABP3MJU0_9DEIO